MFRNYLITAFRHMRRNPLYTGLNIFGLGTGMACSILIFLWVRDELTYDRFNAGSERIFRLTGKVKDIETVMLPSAFAGAIKSGIPAIKNATRISPLEKIISIGTRKFDEKRMYYADSNFLQIFHYPLMRGDIKTVLQAPNSVVLTEATAIKYFGGVEQAMGRTVYIDNDIKGTTLSVTGVLKNIPANSHLQFDLLLPIENGDRIINKPEPWRYFDSYTYFVLADQVKPDPAVLQTVERQINAMRNRAIVKTAAVPASIFVQPLTAIHLHSHFTQDVEGQGNIQYVRIFILAALVIVFTACINFMNLATALSGTRAKEVGLRKTVGAGRLQLTLQFIGESMLLAGLSLVLALALVYAALPAFNTLASKSITFNLLDIKLAGIILGITLSVGALAGCYPAFYMSSLNAVEVLKGVQILKEGKGSFLRNGLVVLQFSIAVILMISTGVILSQLNYLHHRDIGFDRDNLLYIPMPEVGDLKDNADALKAALSQSSRIGDYTIVDNLPTDLNASTPLMWRGMDKGSLVICHRLNTDKNFIKTFGMTMLAGRFYSGDFSGSDSEYVVNETVVRAMQMKPDEAVGKMITIRGQEGKIVGVVKDFNFKPAYQAIEPMVIRLRASGDFLVVRSAAGTMQKTLAEVQHCFQRVYGNNPFSYGFVDQDLDHLYAAETRMGSIFNVFSILSIVISCLGLFGLATFSTRRRRKEIGVRKVLGAGEAGIVVLLAREFMHLVAISLLVAFPIAWFAMHQWLQGFVYRVTIGGWIFVAAGIGALLIAFITVSYQTVRAAIANPVHSLRSE